MNKFLYRYEFLNLCHESLGQALLDIRHTPELMQATKREMELLDAVDKKVDDFDLMNDIMECAGDISNMKKIAIYQHGMRDCIRVFGRLGLINWKNCGEGEQL